MYDYVVIGSGSGGSVIASRLTEDPNINVCLLEAGKPDNSILIHAPIGVAALLPRKFFNWGFKTTPQPHLKGRQGYQPRGKTLGGSSSINAMLYVRGHQSDYDDWANLGNTGWSFQDVLPYFKKAENNERGSDALHGTGGPLNVSDIRSAMPISDVFLDAAMQVQYPTSKDFNGPNQEGVGSYQVTQKNGERWSAAKGYLTPNLTRPNLHVITGAQATKLLFENKKATGLNYVKDGKNQTLTIRREIILCGGAFATPQLLLLSGIGPAADLTAQGIELVHELPGVGQNLQDHIDYVTAYKSSSRDTMGISLGGGVDLIKGIFQWRRDRTGIVSTPMAERGAFLRSDPDLDRPDIQLHFVIGPLDDHARKTHLGHGFSCHACVLRPKSRGYVGLQSKNPLADPLINPNFLSEPEDMETLVKGVKMMQKILEAPAFDKYRGQPLYKVDMTSDEEIRNAIRDRADTVYHPVGSCKMGTDPLSVVNPELRVHGVEGLRIADASIMPTLIGGNTSAPTIMIAEKGADMIKADTA